MSKYYREIKTLRYLPPFLQEIDYYQELTSAMDPEFRLLAERIMQIQDNQFIISSDEQGLRRFERYLGIYPNGSETLKFRKGRALSRWNDSTMYTYDVFIAKILPLIEGNFKDNYDPETYEMLLEFSMREPGFVDEFEYIVSYMMPANVKVFAKNILDPLPLPGDLNLGSASVHTILNSATDAFREDYSTSSLWEIGLSGAITILNDATDAGNSEATVANLWLLGAGLTKTSLIELTDAGHSENYTASSIDLRSGLAISQLIHVQDSYIDRVDLSDEVGTAGGVIVTTLTNATDTLVAQVETSDKLLIRSGMTFTNDNEIN